MEESEIGREEYLQDALIELGEDYEKSLDLLVEMAGVVDLLNPQHPVMQKYYDFISK